ncbi:hypothetical protein K7X08_000344 [Anisodus acutangulus]|uniref:Uncharacterized protein n=1 Tax=Anisodus acutangulus TaxID=402998 RepID=A0A9Q1RCY7_9SOLA|nr:hypothetical protein K7X08_000344 [Anisodus acutangulus]
MDDAIGEFPSVGDPFWEKFLQSPFPTETKEMDSVEIEDIKTTETKPLENGWDKVQNMEHLTEQMELLTSNSKKVSSDGCIFIWKVPGSLSSRMLWKIKENACPLSPPKFAAPATSGQIKLHEVNYHQPEGISMTPKLFQVNQRVLCREGSSPATVFKFSISRLPKWAQAKVTNLHSLMTDPNCSSSKTGKTGSADMERPTCETVLVYEEALHNLDAAADRAVQLFSKLVSQHGRIDSSREPENQLLAKAAEMLVPIAKKLDATAKVAQSANTGSNGKAKWIFQRMKFQVIR